MLKYNILNEINRTGNVSKVREMNAQAMIRYNFLKYFSYEGTAFYATSTTQVDEWADERTYFIAYNYRGYEYGALDNSHSNVNNFAKIPNGGVLKPYRTSTDNYTFRNALTFNKDVTRQGNLNILLGTEARSVTQKGIAQLLPGYFPERGGMFTTPITTAYINGTAERLPLLPSPRIEDNISNFVSFYSAAVYNHANKYIFNVNGRFDGSNKFGKEPKYRYLPTFSTAFKWIASEEPFLEPLVDNNTIDFLALSASYGLQGNIKSDAYPSLVTRVNNVDRFGKTLASMVSLGNPGLRWEQTFSYDFGLEFGLFKRLNFRMDYYWKMGKSLLLDKVVSQVEGRETVLLNAGNMRNSGLELTISGYIVRERNFTWRTTLTAAENKNKVTQAYVAEPGLQNQLDGKALIQGQPLGMLYAYDFAGLDNEGIPLYHTADEHEGPARSMNLHNRKLLAIGSLNPKFNGGFDNSFRYKDFMLTVSLTYNLGGHRRLADFYNNNSINKAALPYPDQNFSSEYVNRWRAPGDEAFTNTPVLIDATRAVSYITSMYPLSGGYSNIPDLYNNSNLRTVRLNYMRVRAINLNYNIPATAIKKIGASSASVYISAQNLWIIASDKKKMNGVDPEVIGQSYAMPMPQIFNLGVNISF